MSDLSDSVWRDYNTDGVPSSGAHRPVKQEIRNLFDEVNDSTVPCAMWTDVALPANNLPVLNQRWRGRVLSGGAVLFDDQRAGAGGSWLPDAPSGAGYIPRDGQIVGMSECGMIGVAGLTRASDSGSTMLESGDAIGVAGYAIADKPNNSVWGGYFEVQLDTPPPGPNNFGFGLEIAVKNKDSNQINDPYTIAGGSGGVGIWLNAGGDNSYGGAALYPPNCAIAVNGNASLTGHTWNTGIIFRNGGLTDLGFGRSKAISMARNMMIEWQSAAGTIGARILANVATAGKDVWLMFQDNQFVVTSTNGAKNMFSLQRISDISTNYFGINIQDPGNGPVLFAAGDDSDITPAIRGKGTGGLNIQSGDGANKFRCNSTGIGFYTTAPVAKPAVSGAKASNAALASLMTALAALGLVTDSTSA